ncbi:IclR family transcriptional regulator [Aquamicrobium sp. LC103]|uniref:IclR family transcriptional regulator n=1 Tax=Aquamicrobium sp. LC103 TaxID=1120658 RepID=UPI00063EC5C3|nr:IclR family transcriptional regulator [Aquamicrobium sp. LC103]TKT69482.1 IclR family transcriptional regulator [Aquamicrobium sp. LC103]
MKSLDSAMRVLMAFMADRRSMGVMELSERLDLPKSQVSKVLATLKKHGLVVQDTESRRYVVGIRAYALGSRYVNFDPLTRESLPVMHAIVRQTEHSARLSVRDGDEVLYLIGVEGPQFFDTGFRAGRWLPWHGSSAGRVLLGYLPDADLDRILAARPLEPVTAHTTVNVETLRRTIKESKQRGYDVQRNETTIGVATIAVPIIGPAGDAIGALSLVFPESQLSRNDEAAYASKLHGGARLISLRMGSMSYPFTTA